MSEEETATERIEKKLDRIETALYGTATRTEACSSNFRYWKARSQH